jgi:hypothetical protein
MVRHRHPPLAGVEDCHGRARRAGGRNRRRRVLAGGRVPVGESQVVVGQLRDEATGAVVQAMSFGLLFVLAALPSCLVWLVFGATFQRLLPTRRAWRTFNLAMGTLLAASLVLFVR